MNERQIMKGQASSLMKKYRAERLAFQILENSPTLTMIASNTQTVFTWVSKSWSDYLGWTFEELTSISFLELIHPNDVEPSYAAFKAFQESEFQNAGFEGEYFINRYKSKSGEWKRIKWLKTIESDGQEYIMFAHGID